MAGLADDTDAVLFVGYHAKAGIAGSALAHTIAGGLIADVRCSGHSLGELGLSIALAAHYGVPPVLVSGHDTIATEAAEVAPGMRCVVVKTALGARSAALLHPDEARDRIQQAVPDALANRESVRPLRFDARIRIAAAVWHNEHTRQPVMRSLTAYDR
ncbi:hypothetical protein Atai01_32700 [Amycolatopsis taiwanensis]|uniref:Uncharacterized protein n=1 Tax=Amycolatopsis taiwanensis TaxID=342230 RepID=A0A9W6VHN7_9PSEU|nr:hypothetical protein Atai01_32700 [Amycolatopsis taiwanensis]